MHLARPLRDWLKDRLTTTRQYSGRTAGSYTTPNEDLSRQICLELELQHLPRADRGGRSYRETVVEHCPSQLLLRAVNAYLHFADNVQQHTITALNIILLRGASAYCADAAGPYLIRRVNTVTQALKAQTAAAADPTAAQHLERAWSSCFGLNPDYDVAYAEAVKAVEQALCPLVSPTNPQRTLGKSRDTLRREAAAWQFALPDPSPRKAGDPTPTSAVERVVDLVELLWVGHVSRHAGSPNTRSQTREESEAAVQIAITVVQWVTSGALSRRP